MIYLEIPWKFQIKVDLIIICLSLPIPTTLTKYARCKSCGFSSRCIEVSYIFILLIAKCLCADIKWNVVLFRVNDRIVILEEHCMVVSKMQFFRHKYLLYLQYNYSHCRILFIVIVRTCLNFMNFIMKILVKHVTFTN